MPRLPAPKPGSIAAVINDIEHSGPVLSAEQTKLRGSEWFTSGEVKAWLETGLRTADLGLITDFRKLGVPPEAMRWTVGGETVLDRIRLRRYSAPAVARMLRNAGRLPRKSA